jgi:hypothetical protein
MTAHAQVLERITLPTQKQLKLTAFCSAAQREFLDPQQTSFLTNFIRIDNITLFGSSVFLGRIETFPQYDD